MAIRPLQDRVIVKRVKEEEKTKGGIIIPDSAKEKPIEGEVVAVGNGKILEDGSVRKLDVKAGDRVLFGKYSGTEVKIEGEEHLILREDDILGVIEKLARGFHRIRPFACSPATWLAVRGEGPPPAKSASLPSR
jgi:chaperonin GroES